MDPDKSGPEEPEPQLQYEEASRWGGR